MKTTILLLTPRLAKVGLLPDDPALIARITGTAGK